MCGIAGIFHFNDKGVSAELLKKMTDRIAHRGPDGEGHWLNQSGNLGFGHRRLSIIDLSDAASQPMHYASGRYTLTFNGEIYNYIELREQLISKGYKFRSNSDTEVLLALYDHKKEKCLEELEGMFAFAIWDEKEQNLFCARDRFGEKPFFYNLTGSAFVFASEIKALEAAGVAKKANPFGVYRFITYGISDNPVERNKTLFENIFQLEPGHYLCVKKDGKIKKEKYWEITLPVQKEISFSEAQDLFLKLLKESVRLRLRSDVPVGSSLSGGIDSSTIVHLLSELKNGNQSQKTFSAVFPGFEKDESENITLLLKNRNGIEPHFVTPDADSFLNDLEKIISFQDEPFGSASIIAQWFVMKAAKEAGIKVMLDGQGADELLAGYFPLHTTYLNELLKMKSPHYAEEASAYQERYSKTHTVSKQTRFSYNNPKAFKTISRVKKLMVGNAPKENDLSGISIFNEDYAELVASARPMNEESKENNDDLRIAQKKIFENQGFRSLLRYADRNSMAHSVEVRLPYLSTALVDFLFASPDHFKIYKGWTKYIQRKAFERFLPVEIAWNKTKIGFAAPEQEWLGTKIVRSKIEASKDSLMKTGIFKDINAVSDWRCLMLSNFINSF